MSFDKIPVYLKVYRILKNEIQNSRKVRGAASSGTCAGKRIRGKPDHNPQGRSAAVPGWIRIRKTGIMDNRYKPNAVHRLKLHLFRYRDIARCRV